VAIVPAAHFVMSHMAGLVYGWPIQIFCVCIVVQVYDYTVKYTQTIFCV